MGTVDVIIVGAGTAGLGALREVRKRTQSFIIINDGRWGTMCARVGCVPSKMLIAAAGEFHRRLVFPELGLRGGDGLRVDVGAVLARVREVRDGFVSETRELTDDLGDRAISGRARLRGPHEVEVGGRVLEARSIVLATGSRPTIPADWPTLADRSNAEIPLQHESTDDGHIAGLNAVAPSLRRFVRRTPLSIVFSDPTLALVGQRFEARDPVRTVRGRARFDDQGRARMMLRPRAFCGSVPIERMARWWGPSSSRPKASTSPTGWPWRFESEPINRTAARAQRDRSRERFSFSDG